MIRWPAGIARLPRRSPRRDRSWPTGFGSCARWRTACTGPCFRRSNWDNGRPAALKVLSAGALTTPEAFQRAEAVVKQAKGAPHPSLLEIYSLERTGTHAFLTCEWVNGFTLVDLLRHRGALPLDEVLRCLEPLAAAADHARQAGLQELDFSPAQVLLAFEATLDLPGLSSLIGTPLPAWPAFHPKVYPFSLDFDDVRPETTWAGLQTIVPAAAARPAAVRQLGLLAYELLGGSPATQPSAQARPPLAALTERGNTVLRQALAVESPSQFRRASDLVTALRESAASDNAEGTALGRTSAGRTAPVATLSPTAFPSGMPCLTGPVIPCWHACGGATAACVAPVGPTQRAKAVARAAFGCSPFAGRLYRAWDHWRWIVRRLEDFCAGGCRDASGQGNRAWASLRRQTGNRHAGSDFDGHAQGGNADAVSVSKTFPVPGPHRAPEGNARAGGCPGARGR